MNIITMYLPQFHTTEENDRWWGKGFTEWTTVNHALPLFEGHNQPRIPLDNNYYNLLDKRTMIWQADLMKKYGIYGQCFYHYWFKNGKQILEKPAENLLKWKEIQMPFCFSWANESWVRSWSVKADSNVWAPKFEPPKANNNNNGILLEQSYGKKEDWKQHFDYLLPFFKDERYIKFHGKPIFMFYRPDDISHLHEMTTCWRQWALDNGLNGVYFISGNTSSKGCLDASYLHATGSMFPASCYTIKNSVKTIPYDTVWEYILAQGRIADKDTYIGGIVDFDTTPRKGKNGIAITGCSYSKYEQYLKNLLKLNEELGNEFTFLNAWNEWGEGMYLEPDNNNSYAFLEATKRALQCYQNEPSQTGRYADEKKLLIFYKSKMEQYKQYWKILDQWLRRKEEGNLLSNTLLKKGISAVAVYGLGFLGEHLKTELTQGNVTLKYAIDTRKQGLEREIPILGLDDGFPEVDAIIVSVVNEYDEILEQLKQKTAIPIISLEEILFEQEYDNQ